MKELTARQKKTQDMRNRIYEEFCRLSREYNGNVTIRDICQAVGITTGSFYNLYKSKEAVTGDVYQYINKRIKEINYPEDPEERILKVVESLMSISMESSVSFMKMAAIYEIDHTPSIARSSYDGQVLFSSTAEIICSALEEGSEKGVFKLSRPAWYYSDMIIFMHRSQLYFWTINNGSYDPLSKQLDYTRTILDSIRA